MIEDTAARLSRAAFSRRANFEPRQRAREGDTRPARQEGAPTPTAGFFAEGWRLVDAALATGAVIDQAVLARDRFDARDEALAQRLDQAGVPMLEVTGEVFDSLGYRDENQSLGSW